MLHTKAQRLHVDHEMSQALALALEFKSPSDRYPEHVWRAMRVAFSAHFRALMEFFHDGRPTPLKREKDIRCSHFLPVGEENPNAWTKAEISRFAAADKLVAHLSQARTRRHHSKREWGGEDDYRVIRKKVHALFEAQPKVPSWFPKTARWLKEWEGGDDR